MSDTGRTSDFWSSRKARVRAEALAEEQKVVAEAAEAERTAQEAKSDEEILAELDLPDPDTLKLGDDVRGFMSKAVPDRLRRRALRQLWKMNPVLANVDGLVDYGQDFTDSAMVVENLQTAYQVGKGMLSHVQEMARQAEEKLAKLDQPEEPPQDDADVASEEDAHDPVEQADAIAQHAVEDAPYTEPDRGLAFSEEDETHMPAPRRRMRFNYTTQDRPEAAA